jgi:hypothetical protein
MVDVYICVCQKRKAVSVAFVLTTSRIWKDANAGLYNKINTVYGIAADVSPIQVCNWLCCRLILARGPELGEASTNDGNAHLVAVAHEAASAPSRRNLNCLS